MAGIVFTLLKGVGRDPWGVGIFDLDLITLLTGYLFLSFGPIQAAAFALGQGLLIGVFSSGPSGLFGLVSLGVFWTIIIGSLLFNFQTAKGQMIIISLTVLLKNGAWHGIAVALFGNALLSLSSLYTAIVSVIGTGLLAPFLYTVLDRLRGVPTGGEDAPQLEDVKETSLVNDHY